MEKEKFIECINSKGLHNSLISIYYNIGRALPFRAQRFPDGRVSEWYRSQFVEVHEVKPSGKGGKYGNAYGFYFRNGHRENSRESIENSWCKITDRQPQNIPCAGCGSWFLLDILGEPTTAPTKVYDLDDVLEFGKHKGETLKDIINKDYHWIEWAKSYSDHFFCNMESVIEERKKTIKAFLPTDILPFGKYKGKTIKDIYELDANYLHWLEENASDFVIDFDKLISL